MKRLLPGRVEMAVFAVAAVICAAIVSRHHTPDLVLAGLAMPLFIGCAFLGMARKPIGQPITEEVEEPLKSRRDA